MRLVRYSLLAALMLGMTAVSLAREKSVAEVRGLYSDLNELRTVADRCEEDLKNFAKRALEESPSCRQFSQRFGERFSDRATMLAEVTEFTDLTESDKLVCDRQCQDILKKCEEMRIGLTYVLDYMDFVKEF